MDVIASSTKDKFCSIIRQKQAEETKYETKMEHIDS